jgi:hypothetical protein
MDIFGTILSNYNESRNSQECKQSALAIEFLILQTHDTKFISSSFFEHLKIKEQKNHDLCERKHE